jgi:hypothetical protein
MAANDNMKEGLKIESRAGTILYHSSWIAGVDYDIIIKSEEKDEEDEKSDQNDDGPENNNINDLDLDEPAELLEDETAQTPVEFMDNNAEAEEPEENDNNNVEIDLQNDENEAKNDEIDEN